MAHRGHLTPATDFGRKVTPDVTSAAFVYRVADRELGCGPAH
jgi:hypothetical protein